MNMFDQRNAIFLVNLVQDVNILRPLMVMAARNFGFRVLVLVSAKFTIRDASGIWWAEIEALRDEIGATVEVFANDWEAFQHLTGTGVIFAGSESTLPAHRITHAVFRYAPSSYLKVTLQHGFECVGFRQSKAHDTAHGRTVSFAADLLCAWQAPDRLTALAPSQRAKVYVTGPTTVLQAFDDPIDRDPAAPGLVCENLHSVRFKSNSDSRTEFVAVFGEYCRLLTEEGRGVVLRPHPGGQYVIKNKVALPANATINNAPMYRLDVRQFAYGISAPSSVLVDMLLADIPTAVWRDEAGQVDRDNYAALPSVSNPREWLEFAREASASPQSFVERQRTFLADQAMPIAPQEVFERFGAIFRAAQRLTVSGASHAVARQRFLFVANAHLPTLQVCLEQPLATLTNSGELVTELLTETQLRQQEQKLGAAEVAAGIDERLDRFDPDAILFSRYSGPFVPAIIAWARRNKVAVIYQIDDDLLNVPATLGARKFAYHNAPERLAAVRTLLAESDLVYASTDRLRERLLEHDPELSIVSGPINCSGRSIKTPATRDATTMGYMASADHLPNLLMILPAIATILDRHPHLSFELFGSIPIPDDLKRFDERVRSISPVADYQSFLQSFGERDWDIGLCPLTDTDFNRSKSNNKWIEYTSLGIAVVASGDMIYDECGGDGCAVLASRLDQWTDGLELLVSDAAERTAMVARAQNKLDRAYGIERHRAQILEVVAVAQERAADRGRPDKQMIEEEA